MIDDPWVVEHQPLEPAKLHAIGAAVAYWNECERLWEEFLWTYLGVYAGCGTPHDTRGVCG